MPEDLDQHDFMSTYGGRRINPVDPDPLEIHIVDIAHSLSQLCRFTGHTIDFYSVAQHSLLVSMYCEEPFKLEGLLHDAAEAYINDLSRPLKHHPSMTAYTDIEETVDAAIRSRYDLPHSMSAEVKRVDNMLVVDESLCLMMNHSWADGHPHLGIRIHPLPPREAERAFIAQFNTLVNPPPRPRRR